MDNTLLDLLNSSYPTQPHSLIATYCVELRLKKKTMQKPCTINLAHRRIQKDRDQTK